MNNDMVPINTADIDVPMSRNISNSEVTTFLSCTQMYDYAFIQNLAPKHTSTPLARGSLGHEAFEFYIKARLNGDSHEQAMKAAEQPFITAMNTISLEIVMETKMLFIRYMEFHNGWPEWELLGSEEALILRISDKITFPIRYDLMVREISTGRILVGDFKFTYDFWAPIDHALNGQMPKYITVLQANGIKVEGGFLEEIRTRPLAAAKSADHKNLWKRTPYFPSPEKKRNMLKQHIAAAIEITEYRALSPDDREAKTIPLLSKHGACKFCNFAELCASKLDGADTTHFIQSAFVTNTYGYNETNLLQIEDI